MIVRLDFHQDVREFLLVAVRTVLAGIKAGDLRAFDHRRIVGIGHDRAVWIARVGVADHAEQGLALCLAVDHPVRVEDLVTAMFRIRLREHHQLDVGGIATHPREVFDQVGDFVIRKRKAHITIGALQGRNTALQYVYRGKRLRLEMLEQALDIVER